MQNQIERWHASVFCFATKMRTRDYIPKVWQSACHFKECHKAWYGKRIAESARIHWVESYMVNTFCVQNNESVDMYLKYFARLAKWGMSLKIVCGFIKHRNKLQRIEPWYVLHHSRPNLRSAPQPSSFRLFSLDAHVVSVTHSCGNVGN